MIRLAIISFAGGAAWLQTRAGLPSLAWLWLAPPGILIWSWLPAGPRALPLRAGALCLLAALAGFFYAAWRADLRLADALPQAGEGRPLQISGRVLDLPESSSRGVRFLFEIQATHDPAATVPDRVQLFLPAGKGGLAAIHGGDCLRLTARLQRPHGQSNPGGFDYEAWLLERGIRASGTVVGAVQPESACGGDIRAGLDRLREHFRERLRAALPGQPHAGVAIALAVGDQNAISTAQWELFRHTGVTHLMSISGLHVTLFATLVTLLLHALWKRVPALCLRLPARKAAVALGLVSAAGYVAVAGFGLPAQRTLYMLAVVAAALWAGRMASPSRVLAAALMAVVLIDPWAAFAPGFWLSFGAVAILIFSGTGRIAPRPRWQEWIRAQWAVTLVLAAPLLALFHEFSLVSPLANAFAIPLISLLAVPLCLLAAFTPMPGLAGLAHDVLGLTMTGLEWLDHLPEPLWHGAQPGAAAILLSLLGAALLLMPRGIPARWLGGVFFLPLLLPQIERPDSGAYEVTVLDVGQGLAAVVRTRGHVLLFDAGPAYPSGEDAGSRVVAPYLHASGERRLDMLLLSHDDLDHTGGAQAVIDAFRPRQVMSSLAGLPADSLSPLGQSLRASMPGRACMVGQRWTWDGVQFEILHPYDRHYENPNYADNERGCVLKVSSRHGRILLPADIERLGEMSLLERVPGQLQAEVLVAPHHGSRTSSSPAFLEAVDPTWLVMPVGHRNRYRHPAPAVMQRYRTMGLRVLRTDRDGAVRIVFGSSGISAVGERQRHPRYWHADAGRGPGPVQ